MEYTVHEILQARIYKWVAIHFSMGSSQSRDQTQISHIVGRFFPSWDISECISVNLKFLIDSSPFPPLVNIDFFSTFVGVFLFCK